MDNYQPHPYYERPSFAELLHEETIAKPMREHPFREQLDEVVARARAILTGVPIGQALLEAGYTDEQVNEALARMRTILDGEPTAARTPSAAALWHVADQEAMYRNAVLAESEGYDEHLDDIERRLAEVHHGTVTRRAHDLARAFVTGEVDASLETEVHIAGCVRAAGRAAFVPKGGA